MADRFVRLPDDVEEAARAKIALFTIGFLKLTRDYIDEDAVPAGSGSLVKLGSVHGILTAAHVLNNLPNRGEVGLVLFPNVQPLFQRQTIDMGLAEKMMIGGHTESREGPDLGFLRLPPMNERALNTTNVFYDLEKRRNAVFASEQHASTYFDAIVGVIAEQTRELSSKVPSTRLKSIVALFGTSKIIKEYESNGFDFYDYEMGHGPECLPPSSYGGMSGGAVWRTYCDADGELQPAALDKWLIDVAFFESPLSGGEMTITCHGHKSVYGNLIKKMRDKWPNLTSAP
jgi:hypothetical protein